MLSASVPPFQPSGIASRNMKVAIVLISVVACIVAHTYTTKWDDIDLDSILNNHRLLDSYVNCLLGDGRHCTRDGKTLRMILPEALEHGCGNCTVKQRLGSQKVIRFFVNKRPDIWEKLSKKYDPNNVYKMKFSDEAREVGIIL